MTEPSEPATKADQRFFLVAMALALIIFCMLAARIVG